MITTSLKQIASHNPCFDGWVNILFGQGVITEQQKEEFTKVYAVPDSYSRNASNDKFPLSKALESNSLNDVLWACRFLTKDPQHTKMIRKFSVWCARQVEHLSKIETTKALLDLTDSYLDGLSTGEELRALRRTHCAAYAADYAAAAAAYATAYAAAAADAAYADAAYAAYAAAADYAAYAAYAAYATQKQAIELQKAKLKQILDAGKWVD